MNEVTLIPEDGISLITEQELKNITQAIKNKRKSTASMSIGSMAESMDPRNLNDSITTSLYAADKEREVLQMAIEKGELPLKTFTIINPEDGSEQSIDFIDIMEFVQDSTLAPQAFLGCDFPGAANLYISGNPDIQSALDVETEVAGVAQTFAKSNITNIIAPELAFQDLEYSKNDYSYKIGEGIFRECDDLRAAKLDTTEFLPIRTFYCSAIRLLEAPNLYHIGTSAFSQTDIKSIKSDNLGIIDDYGFYQCGNLKEIALSNSEAVLKKECFYGSGLQVLDITRLDTVRRLKINRTFLNNTPLSRGKEGCAFKVGTYDQKYYLLSKIFEDRAGLFELPDCFDLSSTAATIQNGKNYIGKTKKRRVADLITVNDSGGDPYSAYSLYVQSNYENTMAITEKLIQGVSIENLYYDLLEKAQQQVGVNSKVEILIDHYDPIIIGVDANESANIVQSVELKPGVIKDPMDPGLFLIKQDLDEACQILGLDSEKLPSGYDYTAYMFDIKNNKEYDFEMSNGLPLKDTQYNFKVTINVA